MRTMGLAVNSGYNLTNKQAKLGRWNDAQVRQAEREERTYEEQIAKLDAGGHTAKKERSRLYCARNLEAKLAEQREGMSGDCGWCGASYPEKCYPASCEAARRDEAYHGR
tara:strand:- start:2832 stop:3161 length:330 start_codon:yes stop_codon:yes gene_type:complete